jgi:SAM-dependent MidA family methyltransferase
MTPLGEEIARLIAQEGPMTLERYMALCLGHPRHGYYMTRDPFGAAGDFTTAPEISQMFGELLGLWSVAVWQRMGSPSSTRLIEIGPGRGTLMADALRATRAIAGFHDSLALHLIETSPLLRARQAETLKASGKTPIWHESIDSALNGPVIVIANELLDALPVRQFVKTAEGWREKLIGIDTNGDLVFGLSNDIRLLSTGQAALDQLPDGTVLEAPSIAHGLIRSVSRHVAAAGGAALLIDYGAMTSGFGDTLQAVRQHAFVDPLEAPGESDLTVHVDFGRLAIAARAWGATVHGPVTQAALLEALGLSYRAATLKAKATPEQRREIDLAVMRLTDPNSRGMGTLFKAMAVSAPDLTELPGFDAAGPGSGN